MTKLWLLVNVFVRITCYFQTGIIAKGNPQPDNVTVAAVLDYEAHLPCDISPPNDTDKPHLIFWYRGMSGSPFYSLDLREKSISSAKHALSKGLKKRLTFRTQQNPAFLLIRKVLETDEGFYRCRVDFRSSPTRYFVVELKVIIPPSPPVIKDENGKELGFKTESYNEESNLFVSCEAKTGKPLPSLLWFRDDLLIDDTYITLEKTVKNDLKLMGLTTEHFGSIYTCRATNNNVSQPTERSIEVNMNLKPLKVKIREERRPLSAKNHYSLKCRSFGSRPPPLMAWWLSGKKLQSIETISPDGNLSTSIVTLQPEYSDNGKYLSCRAENPLISNSGIEDGWTLEINFVPIVTLELGGSSKENNITEGNDVYFECHVSANPYVHAVRWKFYSKYLVTNSSAGMIVSKLSLVIRAVKRTNVGPYNCVGINEEGEGESNAFYLQIKRLPFCKQNQKWIYGVARNEAARIFCELDAFPQHVIFHWFFNNSLGYERNYNSSTIEETRSSFLYLPRTEFDFGTFYCWGTNEMGTQIDPCVFRVVIVEIPDPVTNCIVYNVTLNSFYVECKAGYDGGLPQEFILDIYHATNKKLLLTKLSPRPLFYVTGLRSRMRLELQIYASNSKGRSEVTEVVIEMLGKSREDEQIDAFTTISLLSVSSGIVVVLLLLSITILCIMKCRLESKRNFPTQQTERKEDENDDKCPDVISSTKVIFHTNCDYEFPPVRIKCLNEKMKPQQNDVLGNLFNRLAWENKTKHNTDESLNKYESGSCS